MAAATGVSRAKVHVIWREWGLVSHRWRQFKLSNDPAFAEKLENVVGLYVDPLRPAGEQGRLRKSAGQEACDAEHAVVLSIDEKSHVWMAPGSQDKSERSD